MKRDGDRETEAAGESSSLYLNRIGQRYNRARRHLLNRNLVIFVVSYQGGPLSPLITYNENDQITIKQLVSCSIVPSSYSIRIQ